ncbi:MAG TPA: MFS transporter [Propionibacteriaceae bacterium]|nr:MFS transporter [Propionibacteriaceae bacterium]
MDGRRRTFRAVLLNTFVANITTNFLWFAMVFWLYLETRSVLATSIVGGSFMLLMAVVGVPFGSWIDRTRKHRVMLVAATVTSVAFVAALALFLVVPTSAILTVGSPAFFAFFLIVLAGAIVESARGLALSTLVTLLIHEDERANANGQVGMVNGLGFAITSVFSGVAIGQLGMLWTLVIAVVLTIVSMLHLLTVTIPEDTVIHSDDLPKKVDFTGAWRAIRHVDGLLALIFFTTLNNLLGGVYMALMDPYGLNLVSVEVWGILWGVLSMGFIVGGGLVAKWGLGSRPLRSLLLANVAMWAIGMTFTLRESIWPLAIGIFFYMCLIPVAEAAEQTVLQKVVPYEKQGRVFGFAQSIEVAAAPITAFMIGPVAEFWLIPYANSEQGRATLGPLLGQGQARGMALVFFLTGVIGLVITGLALLSSAYRRLSAAYEAHKNDPVPVEA